ncbi:MAG: peptidylprolyl isomerase [Nitrosarchaeum sp.]|nr:peptidylprolyl isomerase [Nitrosarchaeum sp.]MCV0398482.1 peptidylprolyl isomerase [Nitrosarchaeum sp.]
MKSLLFVLLLVLVFTPAFGQLLSDRTGLVNRLDVQTGGHSFEVESVSNYEITDHTFNKDEKRLTVFINSGLENNIGEMIIPISLLSGNFTFYLNDQQYHPIVKSSDRISFITLNFTGKGDNKIDIIGTTVFSGLEEKIPEPIVESELIPEGGGCLIATAIYGTELAPQVQQLREIRDDKLMQTSSGRSFMESFNGFYYSFSPTIADYQRENPLFKESVKIFLTPMLTSLLILNHTPMDDESEVVGMGIGVILLNVGMYVVAPLILVTQLKQLYSRIALRTAGNSHDNC